MARARYQTLNNLVYIVIQIYVDMKQVTVVVCGSLYSVQIQRRDV